MQRTFNYTGRIKIEQNEVVFSLAGTESEPEFDVVFGFDESQYPADASLYVEAHYNLTRKRYPFGAVSKIRPPKDKSLSGIDLSGSTLFRVLIVDESGKHGLLLASGEGFRADRNINDEKDRSSILTVVKKPLDQLIWKIEIETGGSPELCINSNIPNAIDKMKSDPHFQSLVLPAALRQVLIYYLWSDSYDQDDEIYNKWMEFTKYFGGEKPDDDDPLTLMNWIDDGVSSFSSKFNMCDKLLIAIKED